MFNSHIAPTLFPEVDEALSLLLANARKLLAARLVGMYIYGSLATGDFNPGTSDIDFLVATDSELPADMLPAVGAMHRSISSRRPKWAGKLEGSYIPLRALRRYDPDNSMHPALCVDGSFGVERHRSDWIIQRHLIRETGIVLFGPTPRDLIDPVGPDDLCSAVRGILNEWWSPPFPSPARFDSGEYRAYSVLTMCRALYTLQHKSVASKRVSAVWAQWGVGERWTSLIGRALDGDSKNLAKGEVFDFIQYTNEIAANDVRIG